MWPAAWRGRADVGATDVGAGWIYIFAGSAVLIGGQLFRFSSEASVAFVGVILSFVGVVIALIGVVAEGVRLGLRGS